MDIIFLVIFLIPLALVFKSKEIKQSEYMRELALSEITITFYHYMHTQKLCQKIIQEVKNKEIKFTKTKKLHY
jgi:alanine dehydrogenase